jgi:hypothetical protein
VTVGNAHEVDAWDIDHGISCGMAVPVGLSVDARLGDGADEEIAALFASGNWWGEVSPIVWDDTGAGGEAGWVWVDAAVLEAVPGPGLARRLANAGVGELDDDGLLSAASGWRRLGSWAKAGELAAVAAFLDRRVAQYRGDSRALDAAMAEVGCALGYLTNTAMAGLASLAEGRVAPSPTPGRGCGPDASMRPRHTSSHPAPGGWMPTPRGWSNNGCLPGRPSSPLGSCARRWPGRCWRSTPRGPEVPRAFRTVPN